MGQDNIKKDIRTGSRARNMESKDWSGIEGAVKTSRHSSRYRNGLDV